MGFEPKVNPLFKALTGCVVAFWLHTVAPAQIKRAPEDFSPGAYCEKRMHAENVLLTDIWERYIL